MTIGLGRASAPRESAHRHTRASASRLLFFAIVKMKTLLLLGCLGCASNIAPTQQLDQAISLERDAWGLGAQGDPQAREAVNRANDEIDRTMALMRAGDNARASDMVMRAHVDAELALALSHEAIVRRHAAQAGVTWMASRER